MSAPASEETHAASQSGPARYAVWIRAVAALPFPLLYALAGVLALLARYVLRYRVAVARDNLRQCFPQRAPREIARLLRRHYWHLAQVAVEFLKLPRLTAAQMRARVRVMNLEPVRAELAAGRSVLLLAAHQANWEWALQAAALHLAPMPVDAAYKPPRSPAADRQLRLLRTRFGVGVLAAKRLLRDIARRRRETRAVALLADQVPMSSGGRQWLTFLGRPTAFYPGPADIARSTGWASYYGAIRRVRRGYYELEFLPLCAAGEALESAAFTERYAHLLEAQIRARPSDWMWTHRRWKIAPPPA